MASGGRRWDSKKNGGLLALAEREFDVLLTTDRGVPHQQDLSRFDLTVMVITARSNRLQADAGFAVPAVYDHGEREGIAYTIALITNERLKEVAEGLLEEAQVVYEATGPQGEAFRSRPGLFSGGRRPRGED